MLGLVDADFAAAGESETRELSPTLLTHIGDRYASRLEISQGRLEIVAHQEKFVLVVLFGVMERSFRGRHGKDQPTVAGVHARKLQHIAEKDPVGFGVFGIDDDVCPIDQA